ncbi:MAG: zinc ribbon domain-containing protein [Methanobrevibacter sp.]|nr:zinc ribbon domain-containing protein [Methanobrevibacter sp.]MBQ2353351.1 zinc ribbon domain-containing protein [Methanobrevibacter sp.]
MKKCPECGNPSYDGAPICGNCGYKFPKVKAAVPKREDIFQQEPEVKKASDNEDTISILKNNKLLIGIILIITIIVICGIVLTGSNNNTNSTANSPMNLENLVEFSENDFSFKYPNSWKQVNLTDSEHSDAIFFEDENGVIIEYYNITSSATSLKEITQLRINYAQEQGDYVETVETITLDGRNASNIILENSDGNYSRFVSMFTDGELYVFKISGDSINSITSEDISNTINSADIA